MTTPPPRPWGPRVTAAAVGVAAVIAGLGGAAIYAATGSSAPGGGAAHQAFGPPPGAWPGGAALHGEYVEADHHGGFITVVTQTGVVTAASPTSLSVRSDDGYSRTYALPAGGAVRSVAVDDHVTVRATRTGDLTTVTALD